jgi:uncharacterized membrane protein
MPDIGSFHPQIVHFVVALLFVGVGARLLSFLPLPRALSFFSPASTALILIGTFASVVAVEAGDDAHDKVERMPGARAAVQDHERWGERARNTFLIVSALELAVLALGTRSAARGLRAVATIGGVAGLVVLFEAADHGGDLVYGYAGGVGIRSGDTADVTHLLVAGLYNAALQDRGAGRSEQAARLISELGRRLPADTNVKFLQIESTLRDANNPAGALAALDSVTIAPDDRRLQTRSGMLRADALAAAGKKDSARAVLQNLLAKFPNNPRIKQQLDRLR